MRIKRGGVCGVRTNGRAERKKKVMGDRKGIRKDGKNRGKDQSGNQADKIEKGKERKGKGWRKGSSNRRGNRGKNEKK